MRHQQIARATALLQKLLAQRMGAEGPHQDVTVSLDPDGEPVVASIRVDSEHGAAMTATYRLTLPLTAGVSRHLDACDRLEVEGLLGQISDAQQVV